MRLGRIDDETTANIGVIEGGSATNVVCSFVHLKAEARSTNLDTLEAQVAHMKKQFQDAGKKWGAGIEIKHVRHYLSYDIDPTSKVVQVAQDASRNLGLEPTLRTTLGGSDANVFNVNGVPSIVIATGMQKIHTHDEHVSRADLIKTAELSLEILRVSAKVSRNDL